METEPSLFLFKLHLSMERMIGPSRVLRNPEESPRRATSASDRRIGAKKVSAEKICQQRTRIDLETQGESNRRS
jgi:hypothetical protein